MGKLVELICDKYDGSLKAEHGTGLNMAPYVEREWGAKATEPHVADQGAGRPRRRARPGGAAEPGPGRAPRQPEDDAADRGGRDQLRRVRLLRAGLPEPPPDPDPAPAHRRPPRDGAPGRGLAGAGGAARAVRIRGDRDLRRRRDLRVDLPAQHRHGRDGEAVPRAPRTATRPSGVASGSRADGPPSKARPGRACGSADRFAAGRSAPAPLCFEPRSATSWSRAGRRTCRARRGALPETAREGAAAVYMPACVNRIFGKARGADRDGLELPEAMVAVSARAGQPVWIPDDVAGSLLRGAVELEGPRQGPRGDGERDDRAAVALERGGGAARRHRRELVRPRARRRGRRSAERGEPRAPREARGPRLGGVGARSAAATPRPQPQVQVRGAPPDLLDQAPRPDPRAPGARRGAGGRSGDPGRRDLLRVRGRPRHAAPRADGRGDGGRGGRAGRRPGSRRLPLQQPHLRDRPAAGDRARPTSPS